MKTQLDKVTTRRPHLDPTSATTHTSTTHSTQSSPSTHSSTGTTRDANAFAHATGTLNAVHQERKATQAKIEEAVGSAGVFALTNIASGLEQLAHFEPGRVDFGSIGGTRAPDPALQSAMENVVVASQAVAEASTAWKSEPSSSSAKARFEQACAKLDVAKRDMVLAIQRAPLDQRRILALDTVDAVEVAHNKPGATTKLGYAVEALTKGKVGDVLQKALHLDDAQLAHARDVALRASEWTTLGELMLPALVLASPMPANGEQRGRMANLASVSAQIAQKLGLADGEVADAIAQHLSYNGRETSAAAQILGVVRMLSSLSQPRLFRDKALLSVNDIHNALMQNARPPDAKVDAELVSLLQPVLADAVATLRT